MRRVKVTDNASRVRECLTALATHSGSDVLRVECTVRSAGEWVVIVTHSRGQDEERRMAKLVCGMLEWIFHGDTRASASAPSDDPAAARKEG